MKFIPKTKIITCYSDLSVVIKELQEERGLKAALSGDLNFEMTRPKKSLQI